MDLSGLVGGQEGEEGSDVLGPGHLAEADVARHEREVDLLGELVVVDQRRLDGSGSDGVHP